jgi:hypothetical protein
VFGRLAGYEDVNDAERLCRDPRKNFFVNVNHLTLLNRFLNDAA